MSRCTNFIEELVASELSTTTTPTAATTTTQSYDFQGHTASQRDSNAEVGDIEIQAEETARLGQHDEGSREWQEAKPRQV